VKERSSRFGVPLALLIASGAIAVGGIILLVGGEPAWGAVALLGAVVLVLLPGRVDPNALRDLHFRASALRESVAVRGRGQVELFRARRELAELEAGRSRAFHDLGRAVYEEDEEGTSAARSAADAVAERIRTKEAEIETLIHETEARVRRAHGPVQPTEELVAEAPPEPPSIPEPWPPPDEGDIPEPPQPGPEPMPAPDEPAPPLRPPAPTGRKRR
jgi:hypothetical protein